DPGKLYNKVLRIVRLWMSHGVRIFRVDNPHTKPLEFWERLLADVDSTDPDVIFLAEAFTRPAMMHTLAKIGFHQSYTYFTCRNTAPDLIESLRELSGPAAAYMRPNFFVNTPDILTAYLQHGGPPAFRVRAVLAALLSPTWGVYSGYELCENVPVRPGSEEYLDSEKYQLTTRDWDAPGNLVDFITRVNRVRRAHPALQRYDNLRFYGADDPAILWYGKTWGPDHVFVAVNLDPFRTRACLVDVPLDALGLVPDRAYRMHEQFSDVTYEWRGPRGYVELDAQREPAQIFVLEQ